MLTDDATVKAYRTLLSQYKTLQESKAADKADELHVAAHTVCVAIALRPFSSETRTDWNRLYSMIWAYEREVGLDLGAMAPRALASQHLGFLCTTYFEVTVVIAVYRLSKTCFRPPIFALPLRIWP